jgi:aryl-alcohol dehydrogenase
MNITAAVARKPYEDFSLEDLKLDALKADEVLVKIEGVGLCHTDIISRDQSIPVPLPMVLGHEGSGRIIEVGSKITDLQVGDHVVLSFLSCGSCGNCKDDMPSYCHQFPEVNFAGSRRDGSHTIVNEGEQIYGNYFGQSSFATHALANRRNVIKVDKKAPLACLGPLGCGFQTGAGSVLRSMACEPGSNIVIIGGGSVGMSAVIAAKIAGCRNIILVEPMDVRRKLGLEMGATHAIDPHVGSAAEQIRSILPDGAQYILDNTGIPAVIEEAITYLAAHGFLGLLGSVSPEVDIKMNLTGSILRGHRVQGILEGDSDPETFIPELVQYIIDGQFPIEKLVSFYPLSEINTAIIDQHEGRCLKAVLLPD